MKKLVLLVLCLLMVGCGNHDKVITDHYGNPIEIKDYDYIGTFKNGIDVYIEKYLYNFQDAAWSMILVKDEKVIKLFDGSPSEPKFNKERTKMLYVDVIQFEAIGNVTIYDSNTDTETRLTDYSYDGKQETVKDVEWYDDDSILCIVGFSTGTITQGGMLYQLNITSKALELVLSENMIKEWTDRPFEVVDVNFTDKTVLDITLVEWSDDNFEHYYYTRHHVAIEDTSIK